MLLRTDKVNKHSHIAYLNKASGQGVTSTDSGHSHPVTYIQAQEAIADPMTGEVMSEGMQSGWSIGAAEDGHSHQFIEAVKPKKKKPTEPEKAVEEVKALFKRAKEEEADSRKKAEESEAFFMGEQWEDSTRNKLEAEDRAALTFNEIEAKIDLLSGYQRQNRYDMKFYPVEEGDAAVADILTAVVKNIQDQCNYELEETKVFEDEMIPGRGVFNVYVDYDRNIHGDIITERFPWRDVFFGPHEKEDLSDCEYLIKARWFSKGKVKQMWPDKAKDINTTFDLYDAGDTTKGYATNAYDNPDSTQAIVGADPDFVNIAKKEIRVLECWRKEYTSVPVLVNQADDYYVTARDWDAKDVAAVKTIPGFTSVTRRITDMRVTTTASDVLLNDKFNDTDEFLVVPVYAKKRGNKWWGKVEAAKDPQREINKRRSQVTDILNKVATYGYFYDDQTFADPKEENKFKKNVSKPGFTQKVNDVNRKPVKEEGVKFPGEIVNMIGIDSQKMREILNINMEMSGQQGNATSGVAIAERKRQGLTGNEFLFDNLSLAKRQLGRIYVKLIQKIYTPERIMRLLENRAQREGVEIQGKPMAEMEGAEKQAIFDLLQSSDLTKYDVVVGESANSPTQRLANFAMFMEMASKGLPIPPQMLIKLSPLPEEEKNEMLAQLAQQQQAAQEAEDKKYSTEIQKTIIAKGEQPPQGMM